MRLDPLYIAEIVLRLAIVVVSVVFHEVAHGRVALLMGDPTAQRAGRLTLNPVRHLDPFGSVILPLLLSLSSGFLFAYAKPVPYNPDNFDNRRRGELAVAFAGPAANFALALVGAAVCWGVYGLASRGVSVGGALTWVLYGGYLLCNVNLWLAFFNIIPLPPLDGASIVALFLDERGMEVFYRLKSYSMLILIALLFVIPSITPLDPVGWYFDHTAGAISDLILPQVF